ncbi:MAG: glycerate kinase [Turicibacter sp.]|nr:glycerate kinase [Turicibacter sp.]
MKVVIAIDSLKGSLSSVEAGNAIKEGILRVNKEASVTIIPLADGGEGTVEALVEGMNGEMQTLTVTGPLSENVEAHYGILPNSQTAIIEMAQAAGLPLVPSELRNPLNTTTYGVGEIIKEAIQKGCRHFVVGIGGSATNDAGVGMLQALGFEFLDASGQLVGRGGRVLNEIAQVKTDGKLKELDECTFKIACDVTNPLFGLNGAAHIYGPQKGATPEIVAELDRGLVNFSEVVKKDLNLDLAHVPGVGAAGGLGYAFKAFLNGELESGIDIIIKETNLESHLTDADFVITGEGRLDQQTAMGKAPIGVTKLANKHGIKVIALAGSLSDDAHHCNDAGMSAFFSIQKSPIPLTEAMKPEVAAKNMTDTTSQIFKLISALDQKRSV